MDAASLSHPGASTFLHAASIVSVEALTYLPAAFRTRPYGRFSLMAYCSSPYPIAPSSPFTFSTMSELRSAAAPTGHAGEGVTPIRDRNFELVFDRKSVNT